MVLSSYLEAFLTVYGWETYYVLYLLFASFGIFLYPFVRILIDVYLSYATGSEYAGKNYLLQLNVSFVTAGLVFLLALVPFQPIDLSSTTVKSVCAEKQDVLKFKNDKYFNNIKTRVPLMPWLAMSIGQGVNSVIYNETPCTLDVTETRKAVMAIDLSQAENPELLTKEVDRFVGECHIKATNLLKAMINNEYGEDISGLVKQQMKTMQDDLVKQTRDFHRDKHEQYLLYNYDSPLIKQLFYQKNSPLSQQLATKGLVPLEASKPVVGINGYRKNGSTQQGKATPPSCHDWWEKDATGLKYRMVSAMQKSLAINVGHDLNIPHCQNDYPFYMTDRRKAMCVEKITTDLYDGKGDDLTREMFRVIQGEGKTDSVLSNSEAGKLGGLAIAGVGSSIAAMITGKDLSLGIVGQATSMYMSLFILKLMLKYFLPMILMTIYMFWGVYMVVGEFRGMTMVKGMILIIALTIMPGLWAIVEHLDDSLYSAMYSGADSDDTLKFNMLLLDITTGMFQIAIVFVVFYLIGEAGGGNAASAIKDSQHQASNGAGGIGNNVGAGTNKGLRWAVVGQRNKQGDIVSGGYGTKIGGGIASTVKGLRKK